MLSLSFWLHFSPVLVCSHLVHSLTKLQSCPQPLLGCQQHQERESVTTRFIARLLFPPYAQHTGWWDSPLELPGAFASKAEDTSMSISPFQVTTSPS